MAVRRASDVHDALNKARHGCERRRDSEAAVSCENKAGGLFQHPARCCESETRHLIQAFEASGRTCGWSRSLPG